MFEDQERRLRRALCGRGLCWWVLRKFSVKKEARTQGKREAKAEGVEKGQQGRAPRQGTCLPGGTNSPLGLSPGIQI